MSKRGSRIPRKLKSDAIVEALFEIRFDTTTQSEFLIVRLAESSPWTGYSRSRLPAYGIPENLREADPNLRYQPTFELAQENGQRSVRIGPNVLSYHLRQPYIGWTEFSRELERATEALFASAENLAVTRLGLRYVNAFSKELHGIGGIHDLDLSLKIAGGEVTSRVNVNFASSISRQTDAIVRVATPEFVNPREPNSSSVLADIDVFTKDRLLVGGKSEVRAWLENAHSGEKVEFFSLLKDRTIDELEVK